MRVDRLRQHATVLKNTVIEDHIQADSKRFAHCSIASAGLLFDFSKQLLNQETLVLFKEWAEAKSLTQALQALSSAEMVNVTEQQAALHMMLRAQPAKPELMEQLRTLELWDHYYQSQLGVNEEGQSYTDIVHIGIGGSYLGPALLYEALETMQASRMQCHFIANLADPMPVLNRLDPKRTLLIVASKSFNTEEILVLAKRCWQWLVQGVGLAERVAQQSFAITAYPTKAKALGFVEERILTIPKALGGRYSLWSAMSLSVVLAHGYQPFSQLMQGAYAMDQHALTAMANENMIMMHAMLAVWNRRYLNVSHYAVFPYVAGLQLFPYYCQQLWMESLGKHVTTKGHAVTEATGPLLWGGLGVLSQHSVAQWLHQGTDPVQAEFIIAMNSCQDKNMQHQLWAHCLSQASTLMHGKSYAEVALCLQAQGLDEGSTERLAPHQVLSGNRSSNTIVLHQWDPACLGALLALHEHSVYLQSVLMDVNAFDQFGVEWGKQLSRELQQQLKHNNISKNLDASTQGLLDYLQTYVGAKEKITSNEH